MCVGQALGLWTFESVTLGLGMGRNGASTLPEGPVLSARLASSQRPRSEPTLEVWLVNNPCFEMLPQPGLTSLFSAPEPFPELSHAWESPGQPLLQQDLTPATWV